MTSVRAFSEILREGADMSEETRTAYSAIIHDEALRLTRRLDDLLDLSVLESGQVSLHLVEVALSDIIDRAERAAGIEGDELRLLRDRDGEDISAVTDPDRLAQVFINLMTNARKYCDVECPELRITTRSAGNAVSVDFIDNGSGIPRAAQEVIFEKFSRLSDHRAAGGAGLGLAISREIVASLGGSISYLPGQRGRLSGHAAAHTRRGGGIGRLVTPD